MDVYKKRSILDAVMTAIIVAAVGLIVFMHAHMGEVEQVYIAEERVYAIPFNIGFRWSAIMGMLGVILIQLVMEVMCCCDKKQRMLIWSTGIWISATIVFETVAKESRNYLFFVLRDDLQFSNPDIVYTIGDSVDLIKLFILGIVGVYFLLKWIFDIKEKESIVGIRIIITVLYALLGIIVLVFESYINPWYLLTCISTSGISMWVLYVFERKCSTYLNDEMPESVIAEWWRKIKNLFGEIEDDEGADFEDFQWKEQETGMKYLQERIYQNKLNKGFDVTDIEKEFCLLYGEVAEAYDAYIKKKSDFALELADIAIYLLGIAEITGIDLETEILKKMEINEKREYKRVDGVLSKSEPDEG